MKVGDDEIRELLVQAVECGLCGGAPRHVETVGLKNVAQLQRLRLGILDQENVCSRRCRGGIH